MNRHLSPWLQVLLAVAVASLLTIAHRPPVHAQDDPGTLSAAGPFAANNSSSDSADPDNAGSSDAIEPSTGQTTSDSTTGDSDVSGSSGTDGSSSGTLSLDPSNPAPGINFGGGASDAAPGGSSLAPSTTLAAGPFGTTSLSLSPQLGTVQTTGSPSTGDQSSSVQVRVSPTPTGPDQVNSRPQVQPRAGPGPRLLGIWPLSDILAFLAALLTAIILAIAAALSGLLNAILGGPQGVIFQTPPEYTFQLGPVIAAWNAMRLIAEAGLALVVLVAGYGLMVGHHIGLPSMGPVQVVPRVILGFILIHFSLDWSSGLLQLNNTLSHMLLGQVPTDWGARPGSNDLGAAVVWLIEIVMMLLLALSMWLRIALLDVLLPLGPLMLLLWTSPLTSDWGEWWLGLFAGTALVQFVQDIALWLGSQMLSAGGDNASQGISNRLLAFALLLLVFRIPQLMPAGSASGGTASLLGLSRGADAVASLPVVGGVLSAPARMMGIGGGGGRRSRAARGGGNGGNDGRHGGGRTA